MSRQPQEVGVCDSTTGSRYSFETQNVSSVQQMHSTQSSHVPREHPDGQVKKELDSSWHPTSPEPRAMNDMDRYGEKGPDSTYPYTSDTTSISLPAPPYTSIERSPSTHHVVTYLPACPQQVPQVAAIEKLQPVMHKPLTILGYQTLYQMGLRLDPEMLPSLNWKMMAECMSFNNWEIKKFENEKSPTMAVIQAWARMGQHTIGELITILNKDLARLDVITDIPEYILKDAARHEGSQRNIRKSSSFEYDPASHPYGSVMPPSTPSMTHPYYPAYSPAPSPYSAPFFLPSVSYPQPSSFSSTPETYTEHPATCNSSRPVQVDTVQPSEPETMFDAFVLCNMADKDFVIDRFLPKVEVEAKLKLCFADRDITPGQFAFTDAMNYMFKRSRKLVVILSDEFFASKEHEWQSNLAISQDPASRRQTIIPVKYKKLTNRNIFDYLGCCDLTRTMKEEWFWDKIINGIKQK